MVITWMRGVAIVALLTTVFGLVSACGGRVVFTDDASGRVELLRALYGKYQLEFVIVSDFALATNQYGETYAVATVAKKPDLSVTARAALSDRGSLTDNYSALAFRSQVAGPAERICDEHKGIATCTVKMRVSNSAERWDQGTLENFLKKSGVGVRIDAHFAAGLDDDTYAEQGFELVSALAEPRIPFLLQAYKQGESRTLFAIQWSPSDRPGWITKEIILDYINVEKISPTVR